MGRVPPKFDTSLYKKKFDEFIICLHLVWHKKCLIDRFIPCFHLYGINVFVLKIFIELA
jgi:hypothetical protein